MSKKENKDSAAPNQEELNDLLDSALKDFEKPDQTGKQNDQQKCDEVAENQELWNEDFFTNQARLMGERVNAMMGEGEALSSDQISLGFQKMAEAAAIALQGESSHDDDGSKYANSITEALKGLKDGVENLQAPVSETDVANMFAGLGLGEGEETDANPFLPFMQGMMQSLLSAEVLLPSIKELLEKYPKYLEENAQKLSSEEKERYEKQQQLFAVICEDLESEKPDDASEIKQERFKRVLDNMQKLHEYGQPPEDLIGEVGGAGIPGLEASASNNQCPMM